MCVQYSPNHCPNQVKVYYYFCCSILDYCMDTISTMQAALLPSYNHKQVKDLKCVAHSVATCLVLPHISGPPNMALQIPLFCNHTQLVVQYSAILCNLIVITSWIIGVGTRAPPPPPPPPMFVSSTQTLFMVSCIISTNGHKFWVHAPQQKICSYTYGNIQPWILSDLKLMQSYCTHSSHPQRLRSRLKLAKEFYCDEFRDE